MTAVESTARIGLCASCRWVRVVRNRRGSDFYLCQLAKEDPSFPRYPRLPVLECSGYRPRDLDETGDASEGQD